MILFGDVHLREQSAGVVLGEVLPGLREACLQEREQMAVCLGDFFHFRYQIDARVLNGVLDEFRRWHEAGLALSLLPGNHDQYQVDGRNALEVFSELDNVEVYTEPQWTAAGLWVPYRKSNEAIRDALNLKKPTYAANCVFAHVPVAGAQMNDHLVDTDGIPADWFAGFDRVFCGHYHKRQMLAGKRIIYVGSPWQTRADEAGQPKGYAVLDCSNGALQWRDTFWGPRHHRMTVKAGEFPDLSGVRERDKVQVKVEGKGAENHAERLAQQIAQVGGDRFQAVVMPETEHVEARLAVQDGADLTQYVRAYVEQQGGSFDRVALLRSFTEITGVEVS